MIELRLLTPADWQAHRELRLTALQDSPHAFGATYAENAAYDEATWRARLSAIAYWQARIDTTPVGMAGLWDVQLDADGPDQVDEQDQFPWLIGMFVTPAARGQGIGAALVKAVCWEAAARGHAELLLDVTESNAPARALYERCGFRYTGATRAHPQYPDHRELTMARGLGIRPPGD